MKYIIYSDGACSGNPGPGGWGAVILDNNNKQKPKNSMPMFKATNKEYNIAVITPAHSKILLLIIYFLY